MASTELSVVTGAFGYTGRYIAGRLLSMGHRVRTLTGHPGRANDLGQQIDVAPLDFDDPDAVVRSLEGAETLYNTYWIRFARGDATFERAVEYSRVLIEAAEQAGVRRFVHVSIISASPDSPLAYFRAKSLVEEAIRSSKLSYAIIRPALIFGREDVLVNNIAWALRRFPLFPMFGRGDYRVQPVYVEDVAQMAVQAAQERENLTIDAVGPETYTFEEMVRLIADQIGASAWVVHLRPSTAHIVTRLVGYLVRDVVLTRDEIEGLMAGLLVSGAPPTGKTLLSEWLPENAETLGASYVSELDRHYR